MLIFGQRKDETQVWRKQGVTTRQSTADEEYTGATERCRLNAFKGYSRSTTDTRRDSSRARPQA
jgi:hypothetical protein